jgi:hypothetical protein
MGKIINFAPGQRVVTLATGVDGTPEGGERLTPSGSVGWIEKENHHGHWDVYFPNGAAWVLSDEELRDSAQYRVSAAYTLREVALRIQYGYDKQELSMFDEPMFEATELLTNYAAEIIKLIDENAALKEQMTGKASEATPRVARTGDGYTLTEQPDGSWTDGDLTFVSLDALKKDDSHLLIDSKPL